MQRARTPAPTPRAPHRRDPPRARGRASRDRARLGPCRHSREYFDAGRVIGKYTADDVPGPGGRPWGDTTIRRLHCATPASAMRSISANWWGTRRAATSLELGFHHHALMAVAARFDPVLWAAALDREKADDVEIVCRRPIGAAWHDGDALADRKFSLFHVSSIPSRAGPRAGAESFGRRQPADVITQHRQKYPMWEPALPTRIRPISD